MIPKRIILFRSNEILSDVNHDVQSPPTMELIAYLHES
jgi:hypothetical protein